MKPLLAAVAAATLVCAGAAQAQTVVLVRHAEKAAEPAADPGLTPAGEARARALAAALGPARVTAVFTSSLKRTVDTAAPLAAQAGVTARPVPLLGGTEAHVAATVALVRAAGADDTLVVVGHSNTLPSIARALGHARAADIPDCRYDGLLILRLGARPAAVEARYGAPSETCPAAD